MALLFLFIALKALGNLSLAWGTKHFRQHLSVSPLPYVAAMLNPFVTAGIAMLVLSLLTRLALLSLADLSFVLPVTAIGYVVSAWLGVTFLGETVKPVAWIGIIFIFVGAAVVSSTPRIAVDRIEARNEIASSDRHGDDEGCGQLTAEL